jgi:hypothetical protein
MFSRRFKSPEIAKIHLPPTGTGKKQNTQTPETPIERPFRQTQCDSTSGSHKKVIGETGRNFKLIEGNGTRCFFRARTAG